MTALYRWVAYRPRLVLALIAAVTMVLGSAVGRLEIDGSIGALLPENDPDVAYHESIREVFGNEEVAVLALLADDVFAPEVLTKLGEISTALAGIEGVSEVASLTTAVDPVEDPIDPPKLIAQLPRTPAEIQALKDRLADRPIFLRHLASADGRTAAINVFFDGLGDEEMLASGINDEIEALVDGYEGPGQLVYTGLPRFKAHSVRTMWRDLTRLVPITLVVVVVVLVASFRNLAGVLIPVVTIAVALIWTLGLMVWTGGRLSLGSISLPPLILVLAGAYSLHVVAAWFETSLRDRTTGGAVVSMLERIGTPVLLTAVTTALGFLALLTNRIASIRDLGIYAAAGVGIACVLTLTLVPAALALLPKHEEDDQNFSPTLRAGLVAVARGAIEHRRAILAVSALLSVLSLVATTRIQVDTNVESFFDESDPVRAANELVGERLGGSMAFSVIVESRRPGLIRKFDTLERMRDLQRFIEKIPGIDSTLSFVDYAEILDRGNQSGGGEGDFIVTPEGELVQVGGDGPTTSFWENPSQLDGVIQLVASSPDSFSRVVDRDFTRAPVLVRTRLARSSELGKVIDEITRYAEERFPPEITVRPTGSLILVTRTASDLVTGQIRSLTLAAAAIFVMMSAMFLSLRVGLIAMIPNLVPIALFFGLMGVTGVPLNLGTSIVAAMVLGIVVDDTIHLMSRLSAEVRHIAQQDVAVERTFSTVGKPTVFTSILLVAGFMVLGASSFTPLREFGMLSAASILVALAAELLLLPALLGTTRIVTLWDLLRLKLGTAPHLTIPLFQGLRPSQAKLVALMGELRTYLPGEHMIRRGEIGNEMYVIISGKAEAVLHAAPGRNRRVFQFERGDVVGEMGLIRQTERTADVVAREDLEVMAVTERFLLRIERRYPRTAAKLFRNLSRILSDRLQDANQRQFGDES